jgi:circadian clock protein KaiC
MASAQRVSTGIPGLDAVLAGGLPPRRTYLVQGQPGVGKTTLALQFLLEGVRRGEPTLYVTLSETREELSAVAASHGWDLDGVAVFELGGGDSAAVADENTLYLPSEVELGERIAALLAEVDRVQPRRLVVDSCTELRLLAQTPLRFRRQILALKTDLVRRDCTVLLLETPAERTGDALLQSLVHGVIELEQLSPLYGAERRRLRVAKLREVKFRGGYHDMLLTHDGVVVFPRLVAAEHAPGFEAGVFESGVPALDALLGGGLERGTSALFLGPAGSGKSTFAVRYAVTAASRGECSILLAFDEGLETLRTRAAALGMPLDDHVASGHIRIQQVDPAELAPGQLVQQIRDDVEARGVRIVVIDSLNGYLNAMPEENFVVIQLHEVLSYLRQQGVLTILTLAQHGLVGTTMTSSIDVSYLADAVVILRYFEARGRLRKAVSVLKKRSGYHETSIREYTLGKDGIEVGPPLTEFQGVLTGVPHFDGDAGAEGPLLGKQRE